jgi:hypothetical protein
MEFTIQAREDVCYFDVNPLPPGSDFNWRFGGVSGCGVGFAGPAQFGGIIGLSYLSVATLFERMTEAGHTPQLSFTPWGGVRSSIENIQDQPAKLPSNLYDGGVNYNPGDVVHYPATEPFAAYVALKPSYGQLPTGGGGYWQTIGFGGYYREGAICVQRGASEGHNSTAYIALHYGGPGTYLWQTKWKQIATGGGTP